MAHTHVISELPSDLRRRHDSSTSTTIASHLPHLVTTLNSTSNPPFPISQMILSRTYRASIITKFQQIVPSSSIFKSASRYISTASQWQQTIKNPNKKLFTYISSSHDVFTNLAIEQHLFKHTSPGSRCLFLYTDSPCVVIGRNQNPWLEVDLRSLQAGIAPITTSSKNSKLASDLSKSDQQHQQIQLVRRRSGGGTVFHDQGNVNWSVICDMPEFTRDKHAEMVVSALRKLNVSNARVNERHDVVLDHRGPHDAESQDVDQNDMHKTPWTIPLEDYNKPVKGERVDRRPRKVSGSAYKLARNRALHHGTCLLNSPNLSTISRILKAPAKGYMSARGVDSVSSPVTNIDLENSEFEEAVRREFMGMYAEFDGTGGRFESIGDELLEVEGIRKDVEEMKSREWMYGQTPQFTLATAGVDGIASARESMVDVSITARYGAITEVNISGSDLGDMTARISERLAGTKIYDVSDWRSILYDLDFEVKPSVKGQEQPDKILLSEWLNTMLPYASSET